VRASNEYGQPLVRDHAGRFGPVVALPLPDVDGALGRLGADGVALLRSYQGKYLGDASFAPLFEGLNRSRAVVYARPNTARCRANGQPGIPEPAIELATDTTLATAARTPEKFSPGENASIPGRGGCAEAARKNTSAAEWLLPQVSAGPESLARAA